MSKRWAVNAAALQCIAGLVVQEQRFMVEAEQVKKVNEHLPFTPAGVLLKVVTENVFSCAVCAAILSPTRVGVSFLPGYKNKKTVSVSCFCKNSKCYRLSQ